MTLKIALCFILNYEHILVKEHIWRKWIDTNKDIINVYFFYADYDKIKSDWIKSHAIPKEYIFKTDYYHVLPAYLSLMRHALRDDSCKNEWFVFLTDFCVPILSPEEFRAFFYKHYYQTMMPWRNSWWNIHQNYRANLKMIPQQYHLANSPWFIMTREHVKTVLTFIQENPKMAKTVFDGIVANESFFAIALEKYGQLKTHNVLQINSHIADWEHMSSATSPHIFSKGDKKERDFIENTKNENSYAMFLRKVESTFPDELVEKYCKSECKYENKLAKKPFVFYVPIWMYRRKQLFEFYLTNKYIQFGLFLLCYVLYVLEIIYKKTG